MTLARAGGASPELAAAFEAVGVRNLMRPSVIVFDDVADVLPVMEAGERAAVEAALFGGGCSERERPVGRTISGERASPPQH